MHREPTEDARAWPRWKKVVVSGLIAAHLAALLSAIAGTGDRRHPPPRLAAAVLYATRPYLDAVDLNCPYRFFAPEPGATGLLWLRFERRDGAARWREHPSRKEHLLRPAYERALVQSLSLDPHLGPDPKAPDQLLLSDCGRTLLSSYIRRSVQDLADSEVARIEVFVVRHRPPTVEEMAAGWGVDDLRLYRTCRLGAFSREGDALDPAERPLATASSEVAARVVADVARAGNEPTVPCAVAALLSADPQLLRAADRRGRIERFADRGAASWR